MKFLVYSRKIVLRDAGMAVLTWAPCEIHVEGWSAQIVDQDNPLQGSTAAAAVIYDP